ncbi:putative uncharacterized protein DDB_G0271982 [Drosophila busckii]|uniref:putative uncharacterized protein DDB_G0271982 n=1 Tax=Drosophila busckii TaxID=30019 RepID=UPI001432D8AD|nr:putative uncharacterized protein DDB_G0271982 [Drosophila busckii]
MSRLLLARSLRLSPQHRLSAALQLVRQFAAKPPPKPSTAPKCQDPEPPKPKPGYFPSGGTHAVMDDLPKPEGDFYKAWKAKNSKYNMVLLSSILALVGIVFVWNTTNVMPLWANVPEYPYTEDEMEKFAEEEERRQEEKEEREQRQQDRKEMKELLTRRRLAKEAMPREVELMQKDLDQGLEGNETDELVKLSTEREEFEAWEKEEMKRLEEKEKEREALKKEREKARQEKLKQKEKERKLKEKQKN